MSASNSRYGFIDNAKGIALIIVISWHCYVNIFPHPVFSEWVLPFFFIIMGCFYKHNLSFKQLVNKKAIGLLMPWLLLSFPAFILAVFGLYGYNFSMIINPYKCLLGPCWFLICMFWTYLIFWIVNDFIEKKCYNNKREFILILSILVSSLSWNISKFSICGHRIIFPFFISAAFSSVIFVGVGYYFKNLFLSISLFSIKNFILSLSCILICFICVYLGGGKPFNPQWNQSDQPFILAVICAIAGSYISIQCCRLIPNVFSWIGKNTIPLLVLHYLVLHIIQYLYPNINSLLLFIIVIVVSLPLSYIVSMYIPMACGKGLIVKRDII